MRIYIQDARYHRNGVAGVGFFTVLFKASLNGTRKTDNALAICRGDIDADSAYAEVSIIALKDDSTPNIVSDWRGDDIGYDLIPALRKWYEKHKVQAHKH